MVVDNLGQRALRELEGWYAAEARTSAGTLPSRSALLAAVVALGYMRETYPLSRAEFVTGGNQLKGINRSRVKTIFADYGETRTLPTQAGRTTRGTANFAFTLVDRLATIPEIQSATELVRIEIVEQLQAQVVQWYQQDYLDKERIKVEVAPHNSYESMIGEILLSAGRNAGAVAQHFVGAKLALRFPDLAIENHSHTAGDQQTGRPGDFLIGSTVFHVTVAPAELLIGKCQDNVRAGYRVYLLVPSSRVQMVKGLIENADLQGAGLQDRVSVESSIESFVGQNLDEMSSFRQDAVLRMLSKLLHSYNERVSAVETDSSLQFEIPVSLQGL